MDKKLNFIIPLSLVILAGIYLIYLNSTIPPAIDCAAFYNGDTGMGNYNDYLKCHNEFMNSSISAQTMESIVLLLIVFLIPILSAFLFYSSQTKLKSLGGGLSFGFTLALLFNIYDGYLRTINFFGRGDLDLSSIFNLILGIVLIILLIISIILYFIGKKKRDE